MYQNVGYELQRLEKLFAASLSGAHEAEGLFEIVGQPDHIKGEIARIRESLIQKVFTFENEAHIERYVQFHQRAVIRLMDEIMCGLTEPFILPPGYANLEDLLHFIGKHFSKFVDQDATVPIRSAATLRDACADCLTMLERKFIEAGVDRGVFEIALYPLRKFVSRKSPRGDTFRFHRFIRFLKRQLTKIADGAGKKEEVENDIHLLLYYANCNSKKCVGSLTRLLMNNIGNVESRVERIEELTFILKQVNQAPVKTGLSYHRDAPSLKNQVANYIFEEIEYLQQLEKPQAERKDSAQNGIFNDFKLKLDVSVSQLAFVLRLLTEARIVENTNSAELIRFVSNFCVTKRSERISPGSFRGKFYNVESSTRESVKRMLARLIHACDRDIVI